MLGVASGFGITTVITVALGTPTAHYTGCPEKTELFELLKNSTTLINMFQTWYKDLYSNDSR